MLFGHNIGVTMHIFETLYKFLIKKLFHRQLTNIVTNRFHKKFMVLDSESIYLLVLINLW